MNDLHVRMSLKDAEIAVGSVKKVEHLTITSSLSYQYLQSATN
jgi:hypothetical protein